MTKLEQLVALRAAQAQLLAVYSGSENGEHRVTITRIIREKIGPVVFDLTNEVEQAELFMKTVAELSVELNVNRSTLLKAAQRSYEQDAERAFAYQSGKVWLIDTEAETFKTWLAGCKTGKPRKS